MDDLFDLEELRSALPNTKPLSMSHKNAPALIVGVDFGTTFSGISWALTANPGDIYTVKSWPTKGNSTYQKVPSEISYHGSCKIDGVDFPFDWGFKAQQKHEERIQWIKLLLDTSQNRKVKGLETFLNNSKSLIPADKTPCDVVTDFLKGLHGHMNDEIRAKFGAEFLEVTPKQYIFTVPAMWSDRAKALTLKAAKAAGFCSGNDNLRLVPEPEAAALCCLRTIQPCEINLGDNFVVVDCGGGTVDLISYQILSLAPMEVRESAVGDGDLCGSVILNTLFECLVRKRMGSVKYDNLKSATKELLMKSFDEEVKRSFSDDEDEEIFTVPIAGVADDEDAGIEAGFFVLTRDEMREIFAPVIERIERLVQGQCQQIRQSGGQVSALLLVGGFGSSPYLYKYFTQWGHENGNIRVLQPPDAWSCIVRGAVINGLEGDNEVVRERLARRFYGTDYSEPFIKGYHREKYKVWNERRNGWYCEGRMKWFIRKGDKIQENKPLESNFNTAYFEDEFQTITSRKMACELYAFDGDLPPKYVDAAGVYKVTKMAAHLSRVPDELWNKKNYGGQKDLMELNFALRMIVHGALLKFQMRCDGKEYGTVTTKFE